MSKLHLEKLVTLISTQLGVDPSEINLSSDLHEDLNADPLSLADLMVKIEEEFQIKISQNESERFSTVENLLDFISEQTGNI